jgi:hypothetical protein
MNRTEVIQKIINKTRARTFLEIGVHNGENFFQIKARRKIAVDPAFMFSRKTRFVWMYKNFYNILAKYFEVTSDKYFAEKISHHLDVVFIDGLHTHEQTLRDVANALNNLSKNGVIVMHDCNPPHRAAATPGNSWEQVAGLGISGWTGEWTGDVWKTICYLRKYRNDLRVFVLDCDYGLGIITKKEPDGSLTSDEIDLGKMTYDDLERNRKDLLNLRNEDYLFEFLESF